MNDDTKPTARVRCLQDGRLRLEFDSAADFEVANSANKGSHYLPIHAKCEDRDSWSLTFADSVNPETLGRHLGLQLNFVAA